LLAQEVVREYQGRVQYVVEDFGASALAERFGVDKYPAIFVDDALVARPEDFYAWGKEAKGKYLPWSEIASRRRFQADLRRMIDIRLAGGELPAAKSSSGKPLERRLPALKLIDLQGKGFTFADLKGKPVLVDFWATWCPMCMPTLEWSKRLDGANVGFVSVVVESELPDVDKVLKKYQPKGRVVVGSKEIVDAFGGLAAVPTMFLADAKGRIVRVFYGSPPDLHQQIERELAKLR
jgi:thiol-disulfide isomerase/thioredoxin